MCCEMRWPLLIMTIVCKVQAECITPPSTCQLLNVQYMCYVEHLWLIDGEFYVESLNDAELTLPFIIDEFSEGKIKLNALDTSRHLPLQASEIWDGELTVIHHRIYPHCYAHMLRDTLAHDLFAFRRFHTQTWDVPTIRQNMRMLYLDGQKTTHEGYRIHSNFPPWEYEQHSLGVNIYFRKAVLGHWGALPLDTCHNHYFSPSDWDAFSGFIAQATLGHAIPERDPALVWLVNRDRGESRELVTGENLALELDRHGIKIVTTRPSEIASWRDQVRLARRASVIIGPHGSNLANVIIAGSSASVLELISHELFSSWYAQQCVYQGSRWFSYPKELDLVLTNPIANASAISEMLSLILQVQPYYKPTCKYKFLESKQICS